MKLIHDYIDEQRDLWRGCANTHGRMGSRYLRHFSSFFLREGSNIVNLSSGLSKLNICGDEKTMEYILTISTTAKVFKTQNQINIHVNKL